MNRSHEEIADLLGAYALHAVGPDEAAEVEEHLVDCPRCRAEVREHEAVAALLGNAGGTAPEAVWDRIAEHLDTSPPPLRLAATPRPRRRALVPVLAAAAAVVIGTLGVLVVRQDDRIDELESAMADDALLAAATRALAAPDAVTADLASLDGDLTVPAVLLPDGTGYLMAHGLPDVADGRTYQLWGQTGAGLISLGLLGDRPGDVVPFQAADDVRALAITEEEAPGVAQSQQTPTVVGELG